jgi:hypothetical protein
MQMLNDCMMNIGLNFGRLVKMISLMEIVEEMNRILLLRKLQPRQDGWKLPPFGQKSTSPVEKTNPLNHPALL